MLDDLLVDYQYILDSDGNLQRDPNNSEEYLKGPSLQVYPIHPDDELILFQRPGSIGPMGEGSEVETLAYPTGCYCCYGKTTFTATRTQTIRQKYKHIGCAWTWYPQKYAINGDPLIPQCSSSGYTDITQAGGRAAASDCYYTRFYSDIDDTGENGNHLTKYKCDTCSQILPWTQEAYGTINRRPNFDIWGDLYPWSDTRIPSGPDRVRFIESGWITQYTSFLYPAHPWSVGDKCCTCHADDEQSQQTQEVTADVSCWNKRLNPQVNSSACVALDIYRTGLDPSGLPGSNGLNYQPLKTPQNNSGNIFYSPLQGRIDSVKKPKTFTKNDIFVMGKNVDGFVPGYFVNENLINSVYTPSKGGYNQNPCNYCASSPFLRRLMLTNYLWAFDIFCAGGGGINDAVKTYDLGSSYVTVDIGDYTLNDRDELYRESMGLSQTNQPDPYSMEIYEEMLGESTFFSQFVGVVHLEHYFHYMGTNLDDVYASGANTNIPAQAGRGNSGTNGTSSNPKDRWGYWLTRTTPKIFTFKSSGTPLFQFDLVYADRLGIISSFRDPDPDGRPMTVEKFLSYFSTFSNSVMGGNKIKDGRGKGMYPPGCTNHKYVQVVRDIIGAMCEAGIIGTRDHRENIYNEIKQIIETGIANGENGAYYKPWAPGNAIPVTPADFNALKKKYYDDAPYNGRLCTASEMFPESGLEGLAKFAPIRKVIPPTIAHWEGWVGDGIDVPVEGVLLYKENKLNPNEIFKEQNGTFYNCINNAEESIPFHSAYKIQDLQYSKYYNNGSYNADAPGYVNRQLFFRAIPGSWEIVKWGSLCLNPYDCVNCIGETPCSPYNLYGYGPTVTFNPENLWHSPGILSNYFSSGELNNNILALCNGINIVDNNDPDGCPHDGSGRGGAGLNEDQANCGYGGLCWDASGSPTQVKCSANCATYSDSLCGTVNTPCGPICGAQCASSVSSRLTGSPNTNNFIGTEYKPCSDLFGITCCACVGKSPTDLISFDEWSNLIFGPEQKCQSCSDACLVTCSTSPPLRKTIRDTPKERNPIEDRGGFGSGGGGGGGGGGICKPCPTSCRMLGVDACDPNCGYNGFEYHPLAVVLSQSNYQWGRQHVYKGVVCHICSCSGTNYCYARFGGKIQQFRQNSNNNFYSPQESEDGNLYYVQNIINLQSPIHLLNPNTAMGRTVAVLQNCNTCNAPPDPIADPYSWCVCNSQLAWEDVICPGGAMAEYKYQLGIDPTTNKNACLRADVWCRYLKPGRIKLGPIYTSDVAGNYEY